MQIYEKLEIEIKAINADIITASPTDFGGDTPGVGIPEDMLGQG